MAIPSRDGVTTPVMGVLEVDGSMLCSQLALDSSASRGWQGQDCSNALMHLRRPVRAAAAKRHCCFRRSAGVRDRGLRRKDPDRELEFVECGCESEHR
jgi:hypothetical protein